MSYGSAEQGITRQLVYIYFLLIGDVARLSWLTFYFLAQMERKKMSASPVNQLRCANAEEKMEDICDVLKHISTLPVADLEVCSVRNVG